MRRCASPTAATRMRDYQASPSNWPAGNINHYMCPHCGGHTFSRGFLEQMGGNFWAVNVACLDDATEEELAAAPVVYEDGKRDRNCRRRRSPAISKPARRQPDKRKPAMQHQIVSRDEWLKARTALLAREKAFTKLHDQLGAERRALPARATRSSRRPHHDDACACGAHDRATMARWRGVDRLPRECRSALADHEPLTYHAPSARRAAAAADRTC